MTPSPQTLNFWRVSDSRFRMRMKPETNVVGWTVKLWIFDGDETEVPVLVVTPIVEDSIKGVFLFVFSPDLDGLDSGVTYYYKIVRTDVGSRDGGMAWGPLKVKVLPVSGLVLV